MQVDLKIIILSNLMLRNYFFFVTSLVSTWSLKKISKNKTELLINPVIKTMPIIGTLMELSMKKRFRRILREIANDLVIYLETGKVSRRKQKEINMRRKK